MCLIDIKDEDVPRLPDDIKKLIMNYRDAIDVYIP